MEDRERSLGRPDDAQRHAAMKRVPLDACQATRQGDGRQCGAALEGRGADREERRRERDSGQTGRATERGEIKRSNVVPDAHRGEGGRAL